MGDRAGHQLPDSSYDPSHFARLFAIEDRHFWFQSRNLVIATLVGQVVRGLAPGYRVLEVGCGTGNVLRVLERICARGSVIGMDLYHQGLPFARHRTSCHLVQGDVGSPPFATSFEVIGIFDVLEHLPADLETLRDLRGLLSPGGALLLTVPAHASLWSYFDDASHHRRRYETRTLEALLTRAGFRIEYLSHYMAAIFPLVWAGRRLAGWLGARNADGIQDVDDAAVRELRIAPVANSVLHWFSHLELPLVARRVVLPVGTSLVTICRRD